MKAGKILNHFTAKDGKEVILRTPKWEDLDRGLTFINLLNEEDSEFLPLKKSLSRDEEADWLSKRLAEIEKGNVFLVYAEVEDKFVLVNTNS